MKRLLAPLALLLLPLPAAASPARVEALSANPALEDPSWALVWPSLLAEAEEGSLTLDYGPGPSLDGGVQSKLGHAVWINRGGLVGLEQGFQTTPADPLIQYMFGADRSDGAIGFGLGLSAAASFDARPGQSDDDVGNSSDDDDSYDTSDFAVGAMTGTFSRSWVEQDERTDLAVSATFSVDSDSSSNDFGFSPSLSLRRLKPNSALVLGGGIAKATEERPEAAMSVSGGPRLAGDRYQLSALVGAGAAYRSLDDKGFVELMPSVITAGEVAVTDHWFARGSVGAGLYLGALANGRMAELTPRLGGSFGVGWQRDRFTVDAVLDPTWLGSGPFLLTGTSSEMLGLLSFTMAL